VNMTVRVKFDDRFPEVTAAVAKDATHQLRQAGALIRRTAQKTIRRSKEKPSPKGTPPRTRRGQLRRAILFQVERESVYVGPAANLFSDVGKAHEFGGEYEERTYPARPFMAPAFEAAWPQILGNWGSTLTGDRK